MESVLGELQDSQILMDFPLNWLVYLIFLPKFHQVPAGLMLSCTINTTFGEPASALELYLKVKKPSSSAKAEDGT